MKTKPVMIASFLVLSAAYCLFVMLHYTFVRAKAADQIRNHAAVVASSLWTFEKASPTAYLTLAAKANGYRKITVYDDERRVFLDIMGLAPTSLDEVLQAVGLIPVYRLESGVRFGSRQIGTVVAEWPCRAIYLYVIVWLNLFLLLGAIWLFLKVLESNRTLESRVRERTAALEAENCERKRTEEELRQAMLVVENSPAMLFRWKAEKGWPVVLVSQNVTQIGYAPEELLSGAVPFSAIVHPDDLERIRCEVNAFAKEGLDGFRQEYRIVTRDGRVRWVYDRTAVERDLHGRTSHYQGIVLDITERKRVEEMLRKYERIVSTSQDQMALIGREYVCEAANESMLKAYGKSREVVVGRPVAEWAGEGVFATTIRPRLDAAFSGQTIRSQDLVDIAGRGRRTLDVAYFPIFDAAGAVEGVVLNARDVTEKRKLEEQLMQSQKIESIGTLAGGVAHEINNPINGIMNYAQLILDRVGEGNPCGEYAQEILDETRRIAGIVRNLLTFARNEKQSHSPAHLSDIVASVLSLVQAVMRHDQIELEVSLPGDLPKLKCRSQQIQQVVMNLITNARDALNEKFPGYSPDKRLRLTAALIEKAGRHFVRIMVEDAGTGIAPEVVGRIFDPFFTTKPKETGTGLGLSISYGIVRDHGGELSVDSEPGRGSRFNVDLPVNNGWSLDRK